MRTFRGVVKNGRNLTKEKWKKHTNLLSSERQSTQVAKHMKMHFSTNIAVGLQRIM